MEGTDLMGGMIPWDDRKVSVPEGECGRWKIDRFEIAKGDFFAWKMGMDGRSPGLGTFTRLTRDGHVWMSDTQAEIADHVPAMRMLTMHGGTVLIHGLGIGMVVQYALQSEKVSAVTVVEIDPDVIALAGPHYEKMAADVGKSLTIIEGDALTLEWPKGTYFDIVWHDIWPDLCEDNRDEMNRLSRRFGSRSGWQGTWGKESLDSRRDQDRRSGGLYW